MNVMKLVLITATVLTALLAGIFLAYSLSVNLALHSRPDPEYVGVMQAINQKIQNPLFFLVFMGPVILLPLAAYLSYRMGVSRNFYLLSAAALLYVICTFGVTVGGNVPLNDKLASVPLSTASAADISAARTEFEGPWNRLHTLRTLAAIGASVLLVVVCTFPDAESK